MIGWSPEGSRTGRAGSGKRCDHIQTPVRGGRRRRAPGQRGTSHPAPDTWRPPRGARARALEPIRAGPAVNCLRSPFAMVHSMTAFAREELDAAWGAAAWELRSVNHRYLDVSLRLPEELRSLDAGVRERVAARVRRGKVECSLRIHPSAGGLGGLALDLDLVERLLTAARTVETRARETPGGRPLRAPAALDILRWPGVVYPPGIDRESVGGGGARSARPGPSRASSSPARAKGAKLAEMVTPAVRGGREHRGPRADGAPGGAGEVPCAPRRPPGGGAGRDRSASAHPRARDVREPHGTSPRSSIGSTPT